MGGMVGCWIGRVVGWGDSGKGGMVGRWILVRGEMGFRHKTTFLHFGSEPKLPLEGSLGSDPKCKKVFS